MSQVKYPGVKVRIGGEDLIVPSLSIAQFEQHYDLLSKPHDATSKDEVKKRFAELVPVIGAAIRRNYADKTDDWLRDELDMISLPQALQAVQGASGLLPTTGE